MWSIETASWKYYVHLKDYAVTMLEFVIQLFLGTGMMKKKIFIFFFIIQAPIVGVHPTHITCVDYMKYHGVQLKRFNLFCFYASAKSIKAIACLS